MASSIRTSLFCEPFILNQLAILKEEGPTMLSDHASRMLSKRMLILSGFCLLLLLLSFFAIALRMCCKGGQKLMTVQNRYWIPNASLISSLTLALYACLACSTCLVTHFFLKERGSVGRIMIFIIVLPSPLFLWAWSQCTGAVYSYYLSSEHTEHSPRSMHRPNASLVNLAMVLIPTAIIGLNVVGLPVALMFGVRAMSNEAIVARHTAVQSHIPFGSEEMKMVYSRSIAECLSTQMIYRSIWASWSIAFATTVTMYMVYSTLSQRNLRQRLHFLDQTCVSGDSSTEITNPPVALPIKEQHREAVRQITAERAFKDLSRNAQLGIVEILAFSFYCFGWTAIGLFKSVSGFDSLTVVNKWGVLLIAEISLATVCASVTLVSVIWRSLNILRAQRRMRARRNPVISATSIQITVQTDCHIESPMDDEGDEEEEDYEKQSSQDKNVYIRTLESHMLDGRYQQGIRRPSMIRVRFPSISETVLSEDSTKAYSIRSHRSSASLSATSPWRKPLAWEVSPPFGTNPTESTPLPPLRTSRSASLIARPPAAHMADSMTAATPFTGRRHSGTDRESITGRRFSLEALYISSSKRKTST